MCFFNTHTKETWIILSCRLTCVYDFSWIWTHSEKQKKNYEEEEEKTIHRRGNCAWHPRYFVLTERMWTCERLLLHVYLLLFHYTCWFILVSIHIQKATAATNNPYEQERSVCVCVLSYLCTFFSLFIHNSHPVQHVYSFRAHVFNFYLLICENRQSHIASCVWWLYLCE